MLGCCAGKATRPGNVKPGRPKAGAGDESAQQATSSMAEPGGEEEPDYLTGEEDYVDSDFEGKDGYRKGVPRSADR